MQHLKTTTPASLATSNHSPCSSSRCPVLSSTKRLLFFCLELIGSNILSPHPPHLLPKPPAPPQFSLSVGSRSRWESCRRCPIAHHYLLARMIGGSGAEPKSHRPTPPGHAAKRRRSTQVCVCVCVRKQRAGLGRGGGGGMTCALPNRGFNFSAPALCVSIRLSVSLSHTHPSLSLSLPPPCCRVTPG